MYNVLYVNDAEENVLSTIPQIDFAIYYPSSNRLLQT